MEQTDGSNIVDLREDEHSEPDQRLRESIADSKNMNY